MRRQTDTFILVTTVALMILTIVCYGFVIEDINKLQESIEQIAANSVKQPVDSYQLEPITRIDKFPDDFEDRDTPFCYDPKVGDVLGDCSRVCVYPDGTAIGIWCDPQGE